jgi:hypothetical protein
LNRLSQNLICLAASASRRAQFLSRYVHARQGAARDSGNQFAGQPDGVIADASAIHGN